MGAMDDLIRVRITPDEDRLLGEMVPPYLRGERKAEQRVRWAIEQLTGRGNGKPTQTAAEQENASSE